VKKGLGSWEPEEEYDSFYPSQEPMQVARAEFSRSDVHQHEMDILNQLPFDCRVQRFRQATPIVYRTYKKSD
jgi:hypothetical protein